MSEVVVAEIDAYDPALPGVRTLRFSTQSFVTGASDSPPHTFYEGRIQQAASVTRTLFLAGQTTGQSQIGFGDLVMVNNDGALDYMLDYSFAGRAIAVRLGEVLPNSGGVVTWTTVLRGTMEQAEFSWQRVTIRVRDRQQDLAKPLQQTRYLGNNSLPAGLEGVADDIQGRPKPLVYGRVLNAPVPLVNTSRLIYQVHDGLLQSINAVYDRSAALPAGAAYTSQADMEANAPSAGQYRAWISASGSYVRLGSQPSVEVTVDAAQGANIAARTVGQIWQALLLRAGVSASDIVASDVAALDAIAPWECGLFVGHEYDMPCLEACDLVANSVGAWFNSDKDGKFRIQQIQVPTGASIGLITGTDIVRIERVASRDPGVGIPAWRIKLGYARQWRTQVDLTANVSAVRKSFVASEYRRAQVSDSAVLTANASSPELSPETLILNQSDAQAEATRRLNIYKVRRDMLQVRVRVDVALAATLDIGKIVTLQVPRYGLGAGKKFLVIGIRTDMRNRLFDITLWG